MRSTIVSVPYLAAVLVLAGSVSAVQAQTQQLDHPAVTVKGTTYTPRSILTRNMGTPEDQTTQFPRHNFIGNIYYVGTRTLSSFLVVTQQGTFLLTAPTNGTYQQSKNRSSNWGFSFQMSRSCLGITRTAIIRKAMFWSNR